MGSHAPIQILVGKDGKTAYERKRGRRCNIPTERFGEKIWYKELHGKSDKKHKMESDWSEGLWLGHSRNSNEILVGTRDGVVRAWAIRKKPYEEQWDGDLIKNMKGTPAQPNPTKPGIVIPIRITFEEKPEDKEAEEHAPARTETKPRQVYIQSWMLDVFGYTDGCTGVMSEERDSAITGHTPIDVGTEYAGRWRRTREAKWRKTEPTNDGSIGRTRRPRPRTRRKKKRRK